jgi:REJ domain/PKD domain
MRTISSTVAVAAALLAGCKDKSDVGLTDINTSPIADAGPDQTVTGDAAVVIDGSGSYDPEGDQITYMWSFDTLPAGSSLASREAPFTTNHTTTAGSGFTPDAVGTYIIALSVADGSMVSSPDLVVITVTEGEVPVANAGDDVTATEGATIALNGGGSYDPLGRALTYTWTFAQVPTASTLTTLSSADSVTPSFVPDAGGVYIAALVVNNGISDSAPDTAVVKISSSNPLPPIALAGDDITAEDCSNITVDGTDSYDPNGDDLTYLWSLQSKPDNSTASDTSFANREAVTTSFYADVAGEYVVTLAVQDGETWSTPDAMTILVAERTYNSAPVVNAGADQAIDGGEASCEESGYTYDCDECGDITMTLGGDATATDPDSDPLSAVWTVTSGSATITDSTSVTTTVTLEDPAATEPGACEDNEYVFTLTVTDCTGEVTTDTVTYVVSCCGTKTKK